MVFWDILLLIGITSGVVLVLTVVNTGTLLKHAGSASGSIFGGLSGAKAAEKQSAPEPVTGPREEFLAAIAIGPKLTRNHDAANES